MFDGGEFGRWVDSLGRKQKVVILVVAVLVVIGAIQVLLD
jgi:hypothetical protein|tara:strand:- start:2222 stop:2341 length:120 start_codon:yes stop_codon:yes gene_type:complete